MIDIAARFEAVNKAWTGQRWDDWLATCADDYTFQPWRGMQLDRSLTMQWNRAVFAAYPDYTEVVSHLHVTDRIVAAELTGKGTHTGDFVLAGRRPIPATGRPFELVYVKVLDFDSRGLAVRDRQYLDRLDLFTQLGNLAG
jgi:hypothetical protein